MFVCVFVCLFVNMYVNINATLFIALDTNKVVNLATLFVLQLTMNVHTYIHICMLGFVVCMDGYRNLYLCVSVYINNCNNGGMVTITF